MKTLLGRLTGHGRQKPYMIDEAGPIEGMGWGQFVIDGKLHGEGDEGITGAGKDICIVEGQVTTWSERHGHRLKAKMISRVFSHEIDVLVIGLGVYERIACPKAVLRHALEHGITEVIAVATPEACRRYNGLYRDGRRVALLAHGTC